MIRSISERHALEVEQASSEQACSDQHYQGESDLARYQPLPGAALSAGLRPTTRPKLKRSGNSERYPCDRRHQPENENHGDSHADRSGEKTGVEVNLANPRNLCRSERHDRAEERLCEGRASQSTSDGDDTALDQ